MVQGFKFRDGCEIWNQRTNELVERAKGSQGDKWAQGHSSHPQLPTTLRPLFVR